jgi:hypothetical protein
MENALVAIVSTILIIISSVIMMMSTLQSSSRIAAAWQSMTTEFNNIRTTSITAATDENYYGGPITVRVTNAGQANLTDFTKWDVIAQYEDGTATYLTYCTGISAGANGWALTGIHLSLGQDEIFDPGILDPGEYASLQIVLNPELQLGASVRITVATPSGVTAECTVTEKPLP